MIVNLDKNKTASDLKKKSSTFTFVSANILLAFEPGQLNAIHSTSLTISLPTQLATLHSSFKPQLQHLRLF